MSEYDDILHLPHPVSRRRAPMSRLDRAAQFAPFAALTGYDAAIAETARTTQEFREPEDGKQAELNEKLCLLVRHAQSHPPVTLTYFQPDSRKAGGAYVTLSGTFQKIDTYHLLLLLQEGQQVPLAWLYQLESPLFP